MNFQINKYNVLRFLKHLAFAAAAGAVVALAGDAAKWNIEPVYSGAIGGLLGSLASFLRAESQN